MEDVFESFFPQSGQKYCLVRIVVQIDLAHGG